MRAWTPANQSVGGGAVGADAGPSRSGGGGCGRSGSPPASRSAVGPGSAPTSCTAPRRTPPRCGPAGRPTGGAGAGGDHRRRAARTDAIDTHLHGPAETLWPVPETTAMARCAGRAASPRAAQWCRGGGVDLAPVGMARPRPGGQSGPGGRAWQQSGRPADRH